MIAAYLGVEDEEELDVPEVKADLEARKRKAEVAK